MINHSVKTERDFWGEVDTVRMELGRVFNALMNGLKS